MRTLTRNISTRTELVHFPSAIVHPQVRYIRNCYKKALEINPNSINVLSNLSDVFLQKGQRSDALPLLQKTLTLAKSAGDEALAKEIAVRLEKIYKTNLSIPGK